MYAAYVLSLTAGILSLSLELLWIRLFGYANHSFPQSFSFVLIWFLIGIALGAYIGKLFCQRKINLWRAAAYILLFSAIPDALTPWLYAQSVATRYHLLIAAFCIALTAALKAILFPIAHHLGTPRKSKDIGRKLSRVYAANILGATLGPIVTGIFILAWLTTQQAFLFCATMSVLAGIYYFPALLKPIKLMMGVMLLLSFASIAPYYLHGLIAKVSENIKTPIVFIKENQYGIIAIYSGRKEGDIVMGGNVYDGRTNLDPLINSNGIHRVLILSALHEKPKDVLMIGLSIGSWLKLVTTFPDVENIDVIEINPGYVDAMRYYPQQASALLDPRVHLYIDDGRRWLKTHPKKKYDLLIMNTTYHWRAYSTNLLSIEFNRMLKQHMKKTSVLTYNTTSSGDVLKTATNVFKHAYLYENFVIAADFDWREKLKTATAFTRLAKLQIDGKPMFPSGSEATIFSFLNKSTVSLTAAEPLYEAVLERKLEIVTDDNLITEYKYGKRLQ